MNRFFALLLVALFAVNNVATFTSLKTPAALTNQARVAAQPSTPFTAPVMESSTALNLKVKIDPKAAAAQNNLGKSKAAAYGGSVAIAVLLPVAFLVYAALK